MKKETLIACLLLLVMFFPYWETITIKKEEIVHNYPFAGDMSFKDNPDDRVYVSTRVSCDYWLNRDKQPDVRTIETVRFGLLGLLFGIGDAKTI